MKSIIQSIIKRHVQKQFVVSEETHKALKAYAKKFGYKVQFIADEAIAEYLARKESK